MVWALLGSRSPSPAIACEVVSISRHDEPDLARLSDEILRYLGAHPQAADTVDGIVGWWLPGQRQDEVIDQVQHASDELVARGLVEKIILVDCRIHSDRCWFSSCAPAWALEPINTFAAAPERTGRVLYADRAHRFLSPQQALFCRLGAITAPGTETT